MSGVEREALLRIFAMALLDLARELGVDSLSVYVDARNGYADASVWEDHADPDDMERHEWFVDERGVEW